MVKQTKLILTTLLIFTCIIFATFTNSEDNSSKEELLINRITPEGDNTPIGQQIIIEFNQAVVPLGNMQREPDEIPVIISPALNCQWRWMDNRSLACQLNTKDKFNLATEYQIEISPGLVTEGGQQMTTPVQHTFTTILPELSSNRVINWLSPGRPVINAWFNMPVTKESVEQNIYLKTNLKNYSLKVELSSDLSQEQINDPAFDPNTQQQWVLTPRQDLPLDKSVQLIENAGLVSNLGPLTSRLEHRIIKEFQTFPEFKFLGLRCYSSEKKEQVFIEQPDQQPEPDCDPLGSTYLVFNSPVLPEVLKDQLVIKPSLAGDRTDYNPWAGTRSYSRLEGMHYPDQRYNLRLPEVLKAYQVYQFSSKQITDEFGRELTSPIDIRMMTSHRPAKLVINNPIAVLEKGVDSQLPVYVTNLEKLDLHYSKSNTIKTEQNFDVSIELPQVKDIAFAQPLPIRQFLNDGETEKSGVISGFLNPVPNPQNENSTKIFAQVTPWQVQTKLGHFNSLIWVLDMATGEPVANADVSLFIASMQTPTRSEENTLATTKTDNQGRAILPGLEKLDPDLELINRWRFEDQRMIIAINKDDDLAVLPISNYFSIWDQNVYPWNRQKHGHLKAWGTTAQGIYKPGDTIQYKLYVRDQNNKTLTLPPNAEWNLSITDPTNKVIDEVKSLQLNNFGAFDSEILIPKNASVGWYRFTLTATTNSGKNTIFNNDAFKVLVTDFTPAPFKVKTELNGKQFQPGDELLISTSARLHAGGPYTNAQTNIAADLIATTFTSQHSIAKNFHFDTSAPDTPKSTSLLQKQELLNDQGDLKTRLALEDKKIIYGKLRVESNVQDDRGKSVSNMATAKFIARDQLVGLKNTQWVYQQDKVAEVQYMVVDQQGEPVANTEVQLKIERQEIKASRVKSAGNAYVTEYISDWSLSSECNGNSQLDPTACQFTPKLPGSYRITATIKDSQSREHQSQIYAWVIGKGRVMWQQDKKNNLPIIAEDKNPKIGDTVRYLVKNPYPGAKALITIERYGVLKSWVEDFTDSTEIVEFEIEADFMPGFYLSITAFSPRIEQPLGDNNVDLGKPAFSMGYLKVDVIDPYKQIDVTINSSKQTYKPGDEVELTFSAQAKQPTAEKSDTELAIIVLDEAVFDLILSGEKYFDPYKAFYSLDRLDLSNYSLLSRLVGRQKFEKKGANSGGDGASSDQSMRNIDKYVGYWEPSLILQAGETKSITFKAPDNLTGWRVFAIAVNKLDRLGLGQGSFTVNKDLELRPVMPNQIMQGDQFQAGFNILNRTDQTQSITVNIKASGSSVEESKIEKTVQLNPFKRETVWLQLKGQKPGEIQLTASASNGIKSDRLQHKIPVLKRHIFDTSAVYGSFTDAMATTSVQFPEEIQSDVGQLSVIASPTVLGNIDGAFKYIRDYPYWCWEQRLTKGVMAQHFQNLQDYLPDDLDWPESKSLAEKIIADASNFQAPNGGMAFWLPKDNLVSPYLSAYTALAFSWLEDSGHKIPTQIENKLHEYLLKLLRHDVMPNFYDKGMASTVRSVALAALAKKGIIRADDLQRYHDHVPQMSLFGKAHYLIAANQISAQQSSSVIEEIITEVTKNILSHSVQSAGKFQFNETSSSDYARILATPMRTQCAILTALTGTAKTTAGKTLVGEIPMKIVRAITQGRGARDHWQNTQENMFCMNALNQYSRVYEEESPAMLVKANLDDELLGAASFQTKRDPEMQFDHAITADDPGRKATVKIEKEGSGRLYYTTRLKYAPLDSAAKRVHSGIEIRREYSVKRNDEWQLLSNPMKIKRGELVRVDLFLHLPAIRNFVVIDDPVPGGLEPVNRDLANNSVMAAEVGNFIAAGGSFWFKHDDWRSYNYSRWSFYHQELRHDSVRFYSDHLSPGNYHLSYTAQAIATGSFSVLAAKGEEMYDPDVYGLSLPAKLQVADQ